MKYKKLGEILVSGGLISSSQLKEIINIQRKEGGRFGEILIKHGYITEDQIVEALGKQLEIPYITLSSGKLKPAKDQNLKELIPYDFAIRNICLPLSRTIASLTVAMFDPTDIILLDNLKKMTACDINPVIASRTDILRMIEDFYGKSEIFKEAISDTYEKGRTQYEDESVQVDSSPELSLDKLIAQAEEAPVVKLVDLIIRQAIQERASDIHLEPSRDQVRLRYRVDGVLQEMPSLSSAMYLALISRVKILSKMDIAEKRLPQDGGFSVRLEGKMVDLRASTVPTIYGEKVVLRILDKSRVPLDVSQIGFSSQDLDLIKKGLDSSNGLVLLTGPTGCGKTTTLYALLNKLKGAERNILTIEDPVEYRLDGINQVQVKNDIGLTFAQALRSFLRQDPDIILVGEIRDLETAEICMRAALTGHLVLATLHTNDALAAIVRLQDIGIPNYLLANSLRLIIAQRLTRKLCSHCKEAVEPKNLDLGEVKISSDIVYRAKGCDKCNSLGYRGRSLISEVVLIDTELKNMIYDKSSIREIEKVAKKKGTKSLFESGIRKVEEGLTSIEEVLSVTTDVM